MCGICGFVGSANEEALEAMGRSLRHRGPDDHGTWSNGPVHLGHTRLAIIDLEGGVQPMLSADGSLAIVFNGEIYDHAVLRQRLESRGHRFRTRSDTEVILAAYAEYGPECLDRIHGMFAFILYDSRRRQLFGARDRFGKKPLYYTTRPLGEARERVEFAFASELTSLCQHPTVARARRFSVNGVISYLLRDAVGAPATIQEGVAQLPPAHAIVATFEPSGSISTRVYPYWTNSIDTKRRLSFRRGPIPSHSPRPPGLPLPLPLGEGRSEGDSPSASHESKTFELLTLLDRAVERRLVSDVPLGVLLSGGVDSSAILAMMARHREAHSIKTFSIGFDDPTFDESPHAARVAGIFGTEHHHRLFTSAELIDELPRVVAHLDEPLADPSVVPTSMLSRLAREHVTVALSGEGGDEIFAGYDPFRALGAARWYRRLVPGWLHQHLVRPVARLVPRSEGNMSLDFKIERFLRGFDVPAVIQLPTWLGSFSLPRLRRLLPDLRERLTIEEQFADVLERHALLDQAGNRALDFFQRSYLPNDILRKVDRASMMHSLEVRCPMLDTELAEWANALPYDAKFRRGTTKWILKRALVEGQGSGPILPADIVHRKKKGFGIPIARWLRTELAGQVREQLVHSWPTSLDMFDVVERRRLVDDHLSGRTNNAKEVWALLVLALWVRSHG